MTNNTYAILPLLPPRLDSSPEQYSAYLVSYQLYVDKVQVIRERAKEAAASRAKPTPKVPTVTPPALSEATREKIGRAFSSGVKFGTLEFTDEELTAARKRWQVLHERGRNRKATPLNTRERLQFREAKQSANKLKTMEDEIDFYESTLTPFLRQMERDLKTNIIDHPAQPKPQPTFAEPRRTSTVEERRAGQAFDQWGATKMRMNNVQTGLSRLYSEVQSARDKSATLALSKMEAAIDLKKQEAKLRAAQTATQLNRASLRHTVNKTTKSHVISPERGEPYVVVVPEVSDTTESFLESGSASSVQTLQLQEPAIVSVVSLGQTRPEKPRVERVTL